MAESWTITTSRMFNFPDSDLTIESSDGVRFLVSRQSLEVHSELFSGGKFETKDGVTHLSEPSCVLEILFQFMHPMPQPRLKDFLPFMVIEIAEDVQKYRIFSAMSACEYRLREIIKVIPDRVLVHLLKHYNAYDASLIDEAATASSRFALSPIVTELMEHCVDNQLILSWIRYTERWTDLFASVKTCIMAITSAYQCSDASSRRICTKCKGQLLAQISHMQSLTNHSEMVEAIRRFESTITNQLSCCQECVQKHCMHSLYVQKLCVDKIEKMPTFTSLMNVAKSNRSRRFSLRPKSIVHHLRAALTRKNTTSQTFNFADSDLTIQSSDNVHFKVYQRNLAAHSEVFPGGEINANGEITHLTETASVLEIMFQFMQPMPQPILKNYDAHTVIALAEAVQKYRVFSAIPVCEFRLRELLEVDPQAVLVHILKHYEDYDWPLINAAALASSRLPLSPIVTQLMTECGDSRFPLAWIRYTEKWTAVFAQLMTIFAFYFSTSLCLELECSTFNCSHCRAWLVEHITDLQAFTKYSDFEKALNDDDLSHPAGCPDSWCLGTFSSCTHCTSLVQLCRKKMKSIPDFTFEFGRTGDTGSRRQSYTDSLASRDIAKSSM